MASSASVFLNVTDIDRSLAFYKKLGFKVEKAWKDRETKSTWYADLVMDGIDLGLGNIAANDDPAFRAWASPPFGNGIVVYFTVPDVDRAYKAAKRAGAVIESDLEDRSYGRVFTLNDPDGYTVTFLEEPRRGKAPAKRGKTARKGAKRRAR
ncbi:MAG TPA: VOC family protein [Candidatus Thermoplasmatota archaeon]|nr:VOC family protein [Candidatus Thermoplasmatota archaeon]